MKNNKPSADQKLMEKITKDRKIRATISREDHFWFFNIYFPHYITHPPALFHQEMFKLTQREDLRLIAIMAFRNSGKSTIMNLSYALWAVLGKLQKKFVIIVSKTQNQAEGHFSSILYELKNNERLSSDLGPFEANQDAYSVMLKKLNAKIMFVYRGQSIRGMRHGPHRPGLIILDDIEDSRMIQSEADRNATYEWFETEIMPAGDSYTTIVILGNFLHEDSFLMRIRENINNGKTPGVFRAYPLLDDLGQILWPGKFTEENIEELRKKTASKSVWGKEYLLKITKPVTTISELLNMFKKEIPDLDIENSKKHTAVHLGKYEISAPILKEHDTSELNSRFRELDNKNEDELNEYIGNKLNAP